MKSEWHDDALSEPMFPKSLSLYHMACKMILGDVRTNIFVYIVVYLF